MVTASTSACELCASPAMITDWSPVKEWLAVEGCSCGGFFVGKALWTRLQTMPEPERRKLATDIGAWRAEGREAWISTTSGTIEGLLVISSVMPPSTPPNLLRF